MDTVDYLLDRETRQLLPTSVVNNPGVTMGQPDKISSLYHLWARTYPALQSSNWEYVKQRLTPRLLWARGEIDIPAIQECPALLFYGS